MGAHLTNLLGFLAFSDFGEAWLAGRGAFRDYSPRNNDDIYESIYIRAAADYCRTVRDDRKGIIDADVVACILAFPAIDMDHQLPERLRDRVGDFMAQIESLNFNNPITKLLTGAQLAAPVQDLLIFLGTVEIGETPCDIPSLHQRILTSTQAGTAQGVAQTWRGIQAAVKAAKTAGIGPRKPFWA